MKKLRPPISPSKALGFVNTNCIAIDELQPDLLFLPILALKNTLQYKIQRRLHGQQSTNVIRFNFNLDLDYRQTGQDSRLLEERQWQCRENHDSCGCQEQDQYHWVLFTNCQLGECCNGAANRWCAQTILQVPFSATVPVPSDVSCCLAMLALKKPSLFHGPCKFKFLVSPLPLCQRIPPVPNGIFKTSMPKWKDWPGNKTNIEVYL